MRRCILKLLNRIVSKFKGETFSFDEGLPAAYLFSVLLGRFFRLGYGMLTLWTLKPVYRHPKSCLKCKSRFSFGRNLSIERGVYIDALSKEGIVVGDNVSFGMNTTMQATGSLRYLGKGIKIGNNVGLGTHGWYGGAGGLEIGDDTILGNYVSVHPENHNYSQRDVPIRLQGTNHKGIKIGSGCWIGAKVTILDGAKIGDGCVVAAGAVVRGVFPDNVILGGVPAKIIKPRYVE